MRVLGIDGGIASIGWAVLEIGTEDQGTPVGEIVATGVRTFEAPEVDKTRKPKNRERREHRGQRRVIRRRRQRMNQLRDLFHKHGLLNSGDPDSLRVPGHDPWKLRAEGLDRVLNPDEFAVALGHIARHRGFRSNAKRDRGANAAADTSKMLTAIDATRERLSHWRTIGEMLANDDLFRERKRNRAGDFSRSVLRSDQAAEVSLLFKRQRMLGALFATEDLEVRFAALAFAQRPLQSSEGMVGPCLFQEGERRTARRAPSFERFRFLARLTSLRLASGRSERALSRDEIRLASARFGRTAGLTFKTLRTLLDLDLNTRFAGVSFEDEGKRDVVARSGSAFDGTFAMRQIVVGAEGEIAWQSLLNEPSVLDRVAEVITFREDEEEIDAGMGEAGLGPPTRRALMAALREGKLSKFKGAAHISAEAARAMIPWLENGLVYSEAATEAGYDHSARPETRIEDIGSAVARKALSETLKQIRAVENELGPFDRIHVELARDVGKSVEERKEIEDGIERRTSEKDRLRAELRELLAIADVGGDDLLRYELWKEQAGKSLYSGKEIPLPAVLATDNRVQVDHVLPWSRFGDDSFHNKTLCLSGENQNKRGQTPFEWMTAEHSAEDWELFQARVEAARIKGRKKRNLLLRSAAEVEERFRERSLNDTRYATRVLMAELQRLYPAPDGKRRVFARPGTLTSKMRQAWGIERLKKTETGERLTDDRHHALDAIVVAAITENQLNRLTRAFQEAERTGLARDFRRLPEPWLNFREQAEAAYAGINVSRAELRRARGKAHDATIKQVRKVDGVDVVYERKPIDKLTASDLDRIPVPTAYGSIRDPMRLRDALIETLREWIEAGKPGGEGLPRSPAGDIVRKVRVATSAKVAVTVRDGTADRGEMSRFDVFSRVNARGLRHYYLVPIYPHEIVTLSSPPMQAIQGGGDQSRWPEVDGSFEFLWSIYPMSLLELTKPDGEVILGYCRNLDRNTEPLTVSEINDSGRIRKGIGTRTLSEFRKLSIDRLGRIHSVRREVRTWRGKACT